MMIQKINTGNGNSVRGTYAVGNWNYASGSIVRVSPSLIFGSSSERDLKRKANALFYMSEERKESPKTFERYLAYALARDPYFRVGLSTEPNAELAEHADVVFDRFDAPKNGFASRLSEYNNGSRLFVSASDVQRHSNEQNPLASLVQRIKQELDRVGCLR